MNEQPIEPDTALRNALTGIADQAPLDPSTRTVVDPLTSRLRTNT